MRVNIEHQEPGRLFELRTKDVAMGEWGVVLIPPEATTGDEIQAEDLIPIGVADGMAGDLFVYGAMVALLRKGQTVGAIFHPEEDVEFETKHEDT